MFIATFLGQALGWYRPGEGAGLIGAVVGAIIVLFFYGTAFLIVSLMDEARSTGMVANSFAFDRPPTPAYRQN